jgi:hypothetical protein
MDLNLAKLIALKQGKWNKNIITSLFQQILPQGIVQGSRQIIRINLRWDL